jgi:prepilin-type processing-associated H-X9-DG protein
MTERTKEAEPRIDPPATLEALRELVEQWRGMLKIARSRRPVSGDEIGHESRWSAVEMCADELDAALGRIVRAPAASNGIHGDCWYCGNPGFIYRHSGGYNIGMCDTCRDPALASAGGVSPEPQENR